MLLVNQCILITIQRSLYLIKFSVCFWISFLVLKAPFMYVSHAKWLLLSVTVLVLVFKWNLVLQGWTICSLSFLSFSFSLFNMCAYNSLDVLYKIQGKKENLPSLYLYIYFQLGKRTPMEGLVTALPLVPLNHILSLVKKNELTLDESRLLNKQCRIYSF